VLLNYRGKEREVKRISKGSDEGLPPEIKPKKGKNSKRNFSQRKSTCSHNQHVLPVTEGITGKQKNPFALGNKGYGEGALYFNFG